MPQQKLDIDFEQFEALCELHCTKDEIAAVLKVSPCTLTNRVIEEYGRGFQEVYQELCARGRPSLRRDQRILASKMPAMAIWLGKQWLGQKDEVSMGLSGAVNIEVVNFGGGQAKSWHQEDELPEEEDPIEATDNTKESNDTPIE